MVVRLGLEAGVVVRARIRRDNHFDQPLRLLDARYLVFHS